jgi:hypothetical protein
MTLRGLSLPCEQGSYVVLNESASLVVGMSPCLADHARDLVAVQEIGTGGKADLRRSDKE